MINLDYPAMLDLIKPHLATKRTESASFLIWYLENYYRLDSLDAVDSVCDQSGDKGVDGIYINDNEGTIDVFQSKISQRPGRSIGDAALKEFHGTLSQFENSSAIQNLIDSGGDADVVKLVKRLDLINKIDDYDLRGVFVANIDIDLNGESYLRTNPLITFVGKEKLINSYISEQRTIPQTDAAVFDISGFSVSEYVVDSSTKAIIAPVRARELAKLDGIADQSLFAYNVRGSLGRTQVNKGIVSSLRDSSTHKLFPLFHNGVTVICTHAEENGDKISIENYYVVNGCQSLNALYENSATLTGDLRILTKFVQIEDVSSPLSEKITNYSNNQNGVKARDFKSNSPTQIRLQNEFLEHYAGQFAFEIKRGEKASIGEPISNEEAGLYLMAFDLKEPWATHRKYQVFDEKHADLFGRPEVTADRIVMCHLMRKVVDDSIQRINNELFGKYALTRYFIFYILRTIFENDRVGKAMLRRPADFVRDEAQREKFVECISDIIRDVVVDINAEVDEYGEDFDYRGQLRSIDWVKENSRKIVSSYLKLVQRGRIKSLEEEWHSKVQTTV
jgi:hypothetical protein